MLRYTGCGLLAKESLRHPGHTRATNPIARQGLCETMLRGRAIGRIIAIAWVVSLLLAVPLAAAQGTPYDGKSDTLTLPAKGSPGYLYHQFGFNLATSDLVLVQYRVAPAGAETVFSMHLHTGPTVTEYLNKTSGNYSSSFTVPTNGYYMPQWVNLNAFPVNVNYAIFIYHNGPGLGLPSIPAPLLWLVGVLGGSVVGLEVFLWWRKRQGRHA